MPLDEREMRWNEATIADFRAHGGRVTHGPLAGSTLLLLHSIGVKSGQRQTSPLAYTRDGERYVVVASNSGRDHDPAWVSNVRADPRVTVEVGDQRFEALASIQDGAERRRLLDAHSLVNPIFVEYESMTPRPLPVVSLERVD